MKDPRVFLHPCGAMRSVTAGTVLERTKLTLRQTFYAMLLFCNSGTGISAHFLSRHLGISLRGAFQLGHRIRAQMALVEGIHQVGGEGVDVFIDEMLVRHSSAYPDEEGGSKKIIFGIRDCRRLTLFSLSNRKFTTIYPIIEARVRTGSQIVTDGYASYKKLGAYGWKHSVVNHSKEWKNIEGYTHAPIDSIFRLIRRSLKVCYFHISSMYLWLYLKEIEFRFNRRMAGEEMFFNLIESFPASTEEAMSSIRSNTDYADGARTKGGVPALGRGLE